MKLKKRDELEFSKSQEEFFDCFPTMPCSPPDFNESFSYRECEFLVLGHQIDLPPQMDNISYEEAPMKFAWLESSEFPEEVFLMPFNTPEKKLSLITNALYFKGFF
ncbi:hypothetical protein SteCoe_31988 [Stentor coeruleus]|uniref:Uncharacterized protein n=1 Tax=Stentor coeruleus TaxID=5963 RepID=A0A1R2B027_9CILI|nr:hypothetical protein SteCoe_31988 [Stentor coeruleus]